MLNKQQILGLNVPLSIGVDKPIAPRFNQNGQIVDQTYVNLMEWLQGALNIVGVSSVATPAFKQFEGVFTIMGSGTPTINILDNTTTFTPVVARTGLGEYTITFTGLATTANKLFINLSNRISSVYEMSFSNIGSNLRITLFTFDETISPIDLGIFDITLKIYN